MREQNCRNARQPANEHRRVLCGRSFVVFSRLNVSQLNVNFLVNSFFLVVEMRFQFENEQSLSTFYFSPNACLLKSPNISPLVGI